MYDGRLGRRWNRDPKPNPSISDYATFANNPIWFSYVKGDTSATFNDAGDFTGFKDDGKKSWSGLWSYSDAQSMSGTKIMNQGFKFNDPNGVDIPAIKCDIVTKLFVASDVYLDVQMSNALPADIKDKNFVQRVNYFRNEGKAGGKLDMGAALCGNGYRDKFFLVDGVAYNVADFGNFLIGYAAAEANIPLALMKAGGQYNHITSGKTDVTSCYDLSCKQEMTYAPGTFDSPADQQAISAGYKYSEKRQKAKTDASANTSSGNTSTTSNKKSSGRKGR